MRVAVLPLIVRVVLIFAEVTRTSAKLKVVGAGLGRTGTDSLRKTLNALGFGPTHHMLEVLGIPGLAVGDAYSRNHVETWVAAADSDIKPIDWDEHFGMYESAVDLPAQLFVVELAKKYPDAKVVLTVRDPEKWHVSINMAWCRFSRGGMEPGSLDELFFDFRESWYYTLFSTFEVRFRAMNDALSKRVGRELGEQFANYTVAQICRDKSYAVAYFNAWTKYVKANVPSNRLFVYDTGKTSLAELLTFLEVPAEVSANFKYPHSNFAAEFASGPILFTRLEAVLSLLAPLVVAGMLPCVWYCCFKVKSKKKAA